MPVRGPLYSSEYKYDVCESSNHTALRRRISINHNEAAAYIAAHINCLNYNGASSQYSAD